MRLFVDAWGWLVLGDSRDPLHRGVSRIYKNAMRTGGTVVTTNFVLDEAFSLLFRRRPFAEAAKFTRALLESPFIEIEEVTGERFRKAYFLRLTFQDKPDISFTDLTSMVVAQELNLSDILTGDKHFLQAGLGFRIHP